VRAAGRSGSGKLDELLRNFTDVQIRTQEIKDIEHEGDIISHDTIESLNRTFITPLDRLVAVQAPA
jgi:uncharacterized protein